MTDFWRLDLEPLQQRLRGDHAPRPSRSYVGEVTPFTGLIVDMNGVLYDVSLWRRWLLQLLKRMGVHTHYKSFYCAWEQLYLNEVHCGRRDYWDAFRAYLSSVGMTSAQIDEVEAAGRSRFRQFQQSIRPLPGVAATLQQFSEKGIQLAILTSAHCGSEKLAEILAQLGLANYFSLVLSSYDLGAALPSKECYHQALSQMKLSARQAAFVSSAAVSLSGAAQVGLQTIAVNHDQQARADLYLERFDQLQQVVDPWLAASASRENAALQ